MVLASDLVAKGTTNQYSTDTPTVYCYKESSRGGTIIPCRYNRRQRMYREVIFPSNNVVLEPDQKKVLEEFEEARKRQDEEAAKDGRVCACYYLFGHVHTGFGKSVVLGMYAMMQKGPIMVVVDSDSVRMGWMNTFRNLFNVKDVWEASGSTLEQHDVCILSKQLAERHHFGREAYAYYKTVICDEADTLCTQLAVNEILDFAPQHFIGMSATVRNNNGLDKVLDIMWGSRDHWIKRLKQFGEECSMDLHILHTPFHVETVYNRKNAPDWTAMSETVANIEERNIIIRNLCLLHRDDKVFVPCKRKMHVEILVDMLRAVGEDVSTYYDTNKTYFDAHILIATVAKAGRGYDDKQVSSAFDGRRFDVEIMTLTMKDPDQLIGRALRGKYLRLYVLVDNNSIMKSHCEAMKRAWSRKGANIIEEYL